MNNIAELITSGEIQDKILEIVNDFMPSLSTEQRKSFMEELLDHLCWKCGDELPKFGRCPSCNSSREEHGGSA